MDRLYQPVIAGRQCAKSFLAGRVPDGKFYLYTVDEYGFRFEIDANRERLIRVEAVFSEAHHQTLIRICQF